MFFFDAALTFVATDFFDDRAVFFAMSLLISFLFFTIAFRSVGYNEAMQSDSRLRTLQSSLNSYYMVSDPYNLRYLTGFSGAALTEHEAFMLMNQHNAKLIVPLMYAEFAKKLPLVQQGSVQLIVDEKKGRVVFCGAARVAVA